MNCTRTLHVVPVVFGMDVHGKMETHASRIMIFATVLPVDQISTYAVYLA